MSQTSDFSARADLHRRSVAAKKKLPKQEATKAPSTPVPSPTPPAQGTNKLGLFGLASTARK